MMIDKSTKIELKMFLEQVINFVFLMLVLYQMINLKAFLVIINSLHASKATSIISFVKLSLLMKEKYKL